MDQNIVLAAHKNCRWHFDTDIFPSQQHGNPLESPNRANHNNKWFLHRDTKTILVYQLLLKKLTPNLSLVLKVVKCF